MRQCEKWYWLWNGADNERFGMRSFLYTTSRNRTGAFAADPNFGIDYYNYLKEYGWTELVSFGGTGHTSDPAATSVSVTLLSWRFRRIELGNRWASTISGDEITESNPKGDRRFLQSNGHLHWKGALSYWVGVVWATSRRQRSFFGCTKIADRKLRLYLKTALESLMGRMRKSIKSWIEADLVFDESSSRNNAQRTMKWKIRSLLFLTL